MASTTPVSAPLSTLAIVLRHPSQRLRLETLNLKPLQADEALIEVHATGVCHTDLSCLDGTLPIPTPIVLGHEGAGIVLAVGSGIAHVASGDKVILSFNHCGTCGTCTSGHPAYCSSFMPLNFSGGRANLSTSLTDATGAQVHSHWFGQSSFGRYAIVSARSMVKVPADTDLKLYASLGCGLQTGAGTVMNALKVTKGSTLAVWGVGPVGLAAVMAGAQAGAMVIIAIDLQQSRLNLAREIGATETLHGKDADLVEKVKRLSGGDGVNFAVDCTGVSAVIENMINSLGTRGRGCSVGTPRPGTMVKVDVLSQINLAREYIACIEGDSEPSKMIPYLIEQHKAGRFPVEKLTKYYAATDFQSAFDDMKESRTIKPVLVWSD